MRLVPAVKLFAYIVKSQTITFGGLGDTVAVGGNECKVVDFDEYLVGVEYEDDPHYVHYYNIYDIYPTPVIEVELNDEYTAEIDHKNKTVKVGCQEIPFTAVEELFNKMKG